MFLDTSVIVKLLIREDDSAHYLGLVKGQEAVICDLAVTEVLSALTARERAGFLAAELRAAAWENYSKRIRLGYYKVLPVSTTAFRKAEQFILRCHPQVALRAADALHLAACDLEQAFPLVTNDKVMIAAAKHLGIPVL